MTTISRGDEGGSWSCPFCGSQDDDCPHALGSRDLNFCGDFSVDDAGELAELNQLFGKLGEVITAFLETGHKMPHIVALRPKRLRDLIRAVADGNENNGFNEYVKQVGKDTKVPVRVNSYEDVGAPGFCSLVEMYWAKNLPAAVAGIRQRVSQDIRSIKGPA